MENQHKSNWKEIVIVVLLVFILGLQAYQTYQQYQRQQAAQQVVSEITTVLKSIDETNATYQSQAYDNPEVDRIAEQQLLATETTNNLLARLGLEISYLSMLLAR